LGVQSAPIARGKRHTRLDIARAILERADELRDFAVEHQKLRSAMLKAEETLSEVKGELDGFREMQLIQLADNDDEDFSDEEFYRNEAVSVAQSLGERDDREWGLYADEVIHLEVRSMWGEPEELVVLPGDEIRSQKHRIGSIFNLDDKSAFELELFAMRGDKKHTRMDDMTTFGQHFAPGSQGVVLIGVSMRGGGGEQKRRRDDGEASMNSALVSGDECEEDEMLMEEGQTDEKGAGKAVELMETVRSLHGRLLDHYLDVPKTIKQVDAHVERLAEVGAAEHFKALLFNKVSFPKLRQLAGAQWLSSRNGRWAYTKLAKEYIFEQEFKYLETTLKLVVALKKCAVAVVATSIKNCGLGTARELLTSTLAERAVLLAAREEEKKKGFLSRLLG
jgi:hypothetical protein